MKRIRMVKAVVVMAFLELARAGVARAQPDTTTPPPGGGGATSFTFSLPNPLGCTEVQCLTDKIIDGLLLLAAPIASIMILVGGFQIMTAGGSEEKFKTGRKTILYAVVGYALVLVAKGVSVLIENLLKKAA